MIRRALGAGVLAMLLAAGVAGAATPEGPRLAVFKYAPKLLDRGLFTVGPQGGQSARLIGGGWRIRPLLNYLSPLSWSPDGGRIAFGGIFSVRVGDDIEPRYEIFTVSGDGGDLQPVRGTDGGSAPVFSPDGQTIAFTRSVDSGEPITVDGKRWEEGFSGSAIWTVDLNTGAQRQLTPWRPGLRYVASSFSPDGSTLLASYEEDLLVYEPQPVALKLDGSGSRILLNDGSSPVYSPDGSRIAFLRNVEDSRIEGEGSDLYVMDAAGGGVRRLTHTPGRFELFPSWDPSGQRLAYVRFPLERSEEAPFGHRNALMQVNADGTCETRTASAPRTFFTSPAWQPGPGRGAGRIEC